MTLGTLFDDFDPYPDNIVRFRRMDDVLYNFLLDKDASRKDVIAQGRNIHEPFPLLAEDIFMALYKSQLQIKDPGEIASNLQVNHQLLGQLISQEGFETLRHRSRSNWINALVISSMLGKQVLDLLEQMQEEEPPESDPSPGMDSDGNSAMNSGMDSDLGDEEKRSTSIILTIDESQTDQQLEQAFKAATQALEGLETWIDTFGHEPGDPKGRVNYQDVRQVYNKLLGFEDDLHRLTRELGRMRVMAGKVKKRKPPQSQYGIHGITTGSALKDVIPSELMTAVDPDLDDGFWQKYQEKNLLSYDRSIDAPEGEGPVVICIDCSGSMSGIPILWSKAVTLAALEQIHRKRRDGEVIFFDTTVQKMIMIPGNKPFRHSDLLEVASFFSGGNTAFMPPLAKARDVINSDPKFQRADILLITDGAAPIDDAFLEEFNQWKKTSNVHVITCLIGLSPKVVESFSDRIVTLDPTKMMNAEGTKAAEHIFVDLLSH